MINKILKYLLPEGHNKAGVKEQEEAVFILNYESLKVGELSLRNGVWEFKYSSQFKKQKEINPLTEFPDIKKKYKSKELWPFFAYRIPGLSQPVAQKKIKKRGINPHSYVELLKAFGKKSITDPFTLLPS